ncbi:WG repeat-containing protein [Salirhabdus sp. Marseille-P4669]|uniref:WG repeat-containing protein n=1 Tax=Salirhabdus sp. Marseille-P4669 TaxID=2042310 RepID=UPI000C7B3183|nr:WG repeat-containing protein [Salirhabdus sp. Marseille-P4669]
MHTYSSKLAFGMILFISMILAACSNDEKVKEEIVEQVEHQLEEEPEETTKAQKSITKLVDIDGTIQEVELELYPDSILNDSSSLEAQGYTINDIDVSADGFIHVDLEGPYDDHYYGLLNMELEWIVEPSEYMELEPYTEPYSDEEIMGDSLFFTENRLMAKVIAPISVDEEGLWGYLDQEGNWAIEPRFTDVTPFYNGIALAEETVNEGDKLYYERVVTIDTAGNVLHEITKYPEGDSEEGISVDLDSYNGDRFVRADNGVVDVETGKFHSFDFLTDDYTNFHVLKDNRIVIEESDEADLQIYSFDGELVKGLNLVGEISDYVIYKNQIVLANDHQVNLFDENGDVTTTKMVEEKENLRSVYVRIFELDKNSVSATEYVLGQSIPESMKKDYVYILEYEYDGAEASDFYALSANGKFQKLDVPNEFGVIETSQFDEPLTPISQDRYWVEGKEYAKLVTVDGKTLMEEDKKLLVDFGSFIYGDYILAEQRDPVTLEEKEVVVNMVTFEVVMVEDILK